MGLWVLKLRKFLASWDESVTLCGKWGWMGQEALPYSPGNKSACFPCSLDPL